MASPTLSTQTKTMHRSNIYSAISLKSTSKIQHEWRFNRIGNTIFITKGVKRWGLYLRCKNNLAVTGRRCVPPKIFRFMENKRCK